MQMDSQQLRQNLQKRELPRSHFTRAGKLGLAVAQSSSAIQETLGLSLDKWTHLTLLIGLQKLSRWKTVIYIFSWMLVYILYAELSSSISNTE